MKTKNVKISETLYQGLRCADVDMNTYPTVDAMVEKAVEDFLIHLVNFHKTKAECLKHYIAVYHLDQAGEEEA